MRSPPAPVGGANQRRNASSRKKHRAARAMVLTARDRHAHGQYRLQVLGGYCARSESRRSWRVSSSASGTVSPALAGEHDDSDGNGIRPTGHVRAKKLRRKPEKAFSGRRDLSLAASEKRDKGLVSEQQATIGERDNEEVRRGQLTTPRRATSTSPASAAVSSDQCLCRPQLHRCLSDPKKEFRRGHAPGWEGGGSATRHRQRRAAT